MNINNIAANPPLPPGFRFHPTDQELIIHYLKTKVSASDSQTVPINVSIIADVDLYKYNPWDLPGKALFGEGEWFFFSPRERKYPNGARPNRAAASGYWKATGTDKPIVAACGSECIGVKKALVFYKGRPPKGLKTQWVMHEYRLLDSTPSTHRLKGSMRLDDWVLCRVRQKSTIPFQTGDKHDDSPANSSHTFDEDPYLGKLQVTRKRNDFLEDCDLLEFFKDTQVGQAAEACGNCNPSALGPNYTSNADVILGEDPQPPVTLVSTVQQMLDSIKRSLSFGGLDEYLLLQPHKKLHISSTVGEESPTNSTSMSSCFPEFML